MTKAKKVKPEIFILTASGVYGAGPENEKRDRVALLRRWSKAPEVPEGLRERLPELADVLEREYFPQRRGSRPKTRWERCERTLVAYTLACEVFREQVAMEERGEADPRRRAEEAVAARHNITRRALLQKISRN